MIQNFFNKFVLPFFSNRSISSNLMKNVWDNEHFISHPFICLKNDEQKEKLIEALEDRLTDTDKISLLVLYIKRGLEY